MIFIISFFITYYFELSELENGLKRFILLKIKKPLFFKTLSGGFTSPLSI